MDLRSFYEGKRILVTGHTGFKGAWLCMMLSNLGAEVHGIALLPKDVPNLFSDTNLATSIESSTFIDIRDSSSMEKYLRDKQFDLIFHLAAQALVSEGYQDPIGTFETNVMGTVNLLVSAIQVHGLKGIVCATTDKVYSNSDIKTKFREEDRLGGKDPYGGSKAASEIAIESLYYLFEERNISLVSCRAGNVIGGGDWSKNRLIPDAMRAIRENIPLDLRNPKSTRPWQHVLDCLYGYLLVGTRILETKVSFYDCFNFGPIRSESVGEVIRILMETHELTCNNSYDNFGYEHVSLELDSSKAEAALGWVCRFNSREAISLTSEWYKQFMSGENPRTLTQTSIERYFDEIN